MRLTKEQTRLINDAVWHIKNQLVAQFPFSDFPKGYDPTTIFQIGVWNLRNDEKLKFAQDVFPNNPAAS